MRVQLIGAPIFLAVPAELGTPRDDQLQGSDACKLIELAGRCCYASLGRGRSTADYIKHILESGHDSVLEHAQFSFFITGVSRGLTHELIRHRVGVAISQRSTRYVDESESPWVVHPLLRQWLADGTVSSAERYDLEDGMALSQAHCQEVYRRIVEALESYCVNKGTDKITARKQARGAARGWLGNALETELIWSANVRTLRHVIGLRASAAADAEIREMAIALLKIMKAEIGSCFAEFLIKPSPDGLGEVVA